MESTAIILAGGKSSRMGRNKALLPLNNGVTVIETIIKKLEQVTDQLMIVTNSNKEYEFLNRPMISDTWKDIGPLGGIHAGLSHSTTAYNLVVACDMPYVSPQLGSLLLEQLQETNQIAVVPKLDGRLHPLFAAYHKDALSFIEQSVKEKKFRLRDWLRNMEIQTGSIFSLVQMDFPLDEWMLFNMNHPFDYEQARSNQIDQVPYIVK